MGKRYKYIDTVRESFEYIITELPNNSGWKLSIYDNELDIEIWPSEIYSDFVKAKGELVKISKGNYKQVSLVEV